MHINTYILYKNSELPDNNNSIDVLAIMQINKMQR